MPSPRKILFVSPETPSPAGTGGRVRSWHVLRALAQKYAVTVLVLNNEGLEMDAELGRFCQLVIRPPALPVPTRRPSRWHSLLKTAAVLAFPWRQNWEILASYAGQHCCAPAHNGHQRSRRMLSALLSIEIQLTARRYTPPPMPTLYLQNAARALCRDSVVRIAQERYDVVWVEHSFCHPVVRQLFPASQNPLLVCDAHNVESELQRRCIALAHTPAEARWFALQSKLLQRVETNAFRSSVLTLACSEGDRTLITQLAPGANVRILPNGVDTDYFRPAPIAHPSPTPTLLFTGNFGYKPNSDAATWFIGEIFPHIKSSVPDCRFLLAGARAQAVLDALPGRPRDVLCVSDPADIRPQFKSAWVYVAPLRAGGGTRLKILEAMAMERPVVSTQIGAEGVPYKAGEHLFLADSARDFAAASVRLLQTAELRSRLAESAARFARENFDWSVVCRRAVAALSEVMGTSHRIRAVSGAGLLS